MLGVGFCLFNARVRLVGGRVERGAARGMSGFWTSTVSHIRLRQHANPDLWLYSTNREPEKDLCGKTNISSANPRKGLQRYVHRLSNITSLQKGVLTF
jgi:hypothetical protein